VAERPSLPLLAIELIIRSGSEADANDLAGTASLTGSLLTKGTEKMSAPEIANSIESLGGTIFSSAASDNSSAGVLVMSNKAEPALTILADVVLRPTFKQEEIDRLRKQSLMDCVSPCNNQAQSRPMLSDVLFTEMVSMVTPPEAHWRRCRPFNERIS